MGGCCGSISFPYFADIDNQTRIIQIKQSTSDIKSHKVSDNEITENIITWYKVECQKCKKQMIVPDRNHIIKCASCLLYLQIATGAQFIERNRCGQNNNEIYWEICSVLDTCRY